MGGDVHGPVEERHSHSGGRGWKPDIKEIERCSFKNWYMVLGYSSHRRPVEGRSIGLLEMDALGGLVEGRPSIKRIRRCSPNNTGVRGTTQGGRLTRGWRRNSLRCLLNETGGRMKQGGRLTSATRSLRSSESAVDTHEGKADESYERRFPWKGQSFSGSPVDKRPWQVDWTALPRHRFGGHWRWTRAVCIPGRNPVKFLQSPSSPKVGPKLGEQCRTQVPISAGSGDLRPTLDEENAPPLVQEQRAASRRSWQRYKVLVIVETKPLWCSVFRTSFPVRFWRPSPPPSFSEHSSTFATTTTATGSSLQLPSLPWRLLTMVMPTTTRLWQFLTGESPLANWVVSLLAACTLKQVKTGHLICPQIPEALKSGALPSTDLANLLVFAP